MINEGNILQFFLMLAFIGDAEPTASRKISLRFILEHVLNH